MIIIDLRDIIENKENEPETYKVWQEAILNQEGITIEEMAENTLMMIAEEDFKEFAQELADAKDYLWPTNYIDRKYAAKKLRHDCSSIEVDGRTFLFETY